MRLNNPRLQRRQPGLRHALSAAVPDCSGERGIDRSGATAGDAVTAEANVAVAVVVASSAEVMSVANKASNTAIRPLRRLLGMWWRTLRSWP